MPVNQIGFNDDDGSIFGSSSSKKIAFYGKTPTTQPSGTSQAAVTITSAKTTTALRTDLDATAALANALRSALVNLGLIKGSA